MMMRLMMPQSTTDEQGFLVTHESRQDKPTPTGQWPQAWVIRNNTETLGLRSLDRLIFACGLLLQVVVFFFLKIDVHFMHFA
jgi:hypothetical protein